MFVEKNVLNVICSPPTPPRLPGKHFDTDTQDLAGIEWAPNGCVLAVWDSCLEVGSPLRTHSACSTAVCFSPSLNASSVNSAFFRC